MAEFVIRTTRLGDGHQKYVSVIGRKIKNVITNGVYFRLKLKISNVKHITIFILVLRFFVSHWALLNLPFICLHCSQLVNENIPDGFNVIHNNT